VSGGELHPWTSAYVIATIVCGAAGLVLWFVVEKHWVKCVPFLSPVIQLELVERALTSLASRRHPTVPFDAMMNRTSLVGFLTTFLHGVVAMGVYYYWCVQYSSRSNC